MEQLLFKGKQVKLLLALTDNSHEWHLTNLSKVANATYVHTSRFISACEEKGIIFSERHGRIKNIRLTPKGSAIAKSVGEIMDKLNAKGEEEETAAEAKPEPKAAV